MSASLRYIEDELKRLTEAVGEASETYAYHAGLQVKVGLLQVHATAGGLLTNEQYETLRKEILDEVLE